MAALSTLEALSIIRPMEQNLARLNIPAYSRNERYSDDGGKEKPRSEKEKELLGKWLDALAWLAIGATPGGPANQVCAVSLSLLPKKCVITMAFNVTPPNEGDVKELVERIWEWMKAASMRKEALTRDETAEFNESLLANVLRAAQDRLRRRLRDKGKFLPDLFSKIEAAELTAPQQHFIRAARAFHQDMLERLGPDAKKTDFDTAATAFGFHSRQYDAAKSSLNGDIHWLLPFESAALEDARSQLKVKAGARLPSLIRHMDKLQKPYRYYALIEGAVRRSVMKTVVGAMTLKVDTLLPPPADATFAFISQNPLEIQTLTSTLETEQEFEVRVRSYLRGALLSASTEEATTPYAEEAVTDFFLLIQQFLNKHNGKLPNLLSPHCECLLLRHHLNHYLDDTSTSTPPRIPYPYLGVSKLSCFQCTLYFQAYKACHLGPPFQTRGSHMEVFACALPKHPGAPDAADQAIETEMGSQLGTIVGALLVANVGERRKLSLSSVESVTSSDSAPIGKPYVVSARLYGTGHTEPKQ
ncbi:hypothetical protein DFH06DRAFT_1165468 [Mycena polygramma]|nr:hypothetical protein DFH06DRAFT_1165468 [Mycena polygramma]